MYFKPLPQLNRQDAAGQESRISHLVPRRQLPFMHQKEVSFWKEGAHPSFQDALAGQINAQPYYPAYPVQPVYPMYPGYPAYPPYQAGMPPYFGPSYPGNAPPQPVNPTPPQKTGDPEIRWADPPDVPSGISQKEDKIYFNGDFVAVIDTGQGGQLDELYYGGEQLLFGNGLWMHSSPHGASDGSGLGYEMAYNEQPQVTVNGNQITVEGRLYRSNNSGEFAGHRYRRTYTFDRPDSFRVDHEMWVSSQDQATARQQFGEVPDEFYVWAAPLDANLPNYAWNAGNYWQGVANYWQQVSQDPNSQGRIPEIPQGRENWGLTTTLDNMPSKPQTAIYRPGGPAITREILSGDLAQINIWHNPSGQNGRTLEFSVMGQDRTFFDSTYKLPGAFKGGESYKFSERITIGQASKLVSDPSRQSPTSPRPNLYTQYGG